MVVPSNSIQGLPAGTYTSTGYFCNDVIVVHIVYLRTLLAVLGGFNFFHRVQRLPDELSTLFQMFAFPRPSWHGRGEESIILLQ